MALAAARYRTTPVIADADPNVALTSILLKDQGVSIRWMRQALGTFAEGGDSNAAVLETLGVFFATGQNYSRTAELLGVHRNTVRHRVARFEAQRGIAGQQTSIEQLDPLEVALALRIHDTFEG